MKRYGNLYEGIYSYNNLLEAHNKARKGKSHYKEVQMVDNNLEYYLLKLQAQLKNETYNTGKYKIFRIDDKGKQRMIYSLPYYPDRICQWAIMLKIESIFIKNFIYDTYASIPNKGIHLVSNRISNHLKKDVINTKYCLKLDIKQYFPSINKNILKRLLMHKFKDAKLLRLLNNIIESSNNGVPIGNYISQYFANFYLSYFDHYLKEKLNIKYYYRYMDDMVILGSTKKYLKTIKLDLERYLNNNLQLSIKDNWQIFPVNMRGIDFVGFRIFRYYKLLRKKIAENIKIKINKLHKKRILLYNDYNSIMSYMGWLSSCNCYNFMNTYIFPILRRFNTNENILRSYIR